METLCMEYYSLKLSKDELTDHEYNTPGSWLANAVNAVAYNPMGGSEKLRTT